MCLYDVLDLLVNVWGAGLIAGLQLTFFNFRQGFYPPNLDGREAHDRIIAGNVNLATLPPSIHPEHLAARWTGKLKIDHAGEYKIHMATPGYGISAAKLWLDSSVVVRHELTTGT